MALNFKCCENRIAKINFSTVFVQLPCKLLAFILLEYYQGADSVYCEPAAKS